MQTFFRAGTVFLAGFLAGKAQAYVSYNGLVTTPAMGKQSRNPPLPPQAPSLTSQAGITGMPLAVKSTRSSSSQPLRRLSTLGCAI